MDLVWDEVKYFIKVSRPGLWPTAVWFYLLPLGQRDVFVTTSFWLGLFYVTFPMGFLIYGWNDIGDLATDHSNPRKDTYLFGARGTPAQLAELAPRIWLVQAPFVLLFCFLLGIKGLWWFAAVVATVGLYNWPRYGLKGRPPLEILNQAGYLLVLPLSSWLNHAPQLPLPAFVFGALFAMHAHLLSEIMDIDPDRRSGRQTTATVLGATLAKLALAGLLAVESLLVFGFFRDLVIGGALALGACWFATDAGTLWKNRLYPPQQMRRFLIAWNAFALASMGWVWSTASLTRVMKVGVWN